MMKRMLTLLAALVLCTSCTALPAEERAFAVALAIGGKAGAWEMHARIPTYQAGGGYATVSGDGDTLPHAFAAMDAMAPMPLHPGQLRLVIVEADTAAEALPAVLSWLGEQRELRPGAVLCVTQSGAGAIMEALKPATGSRLSKSIDTLLESRMQQGVIPRAALAEVLAGGMRQSPVLVNLTLEGQEIGLSGGWPVGDDGRTGGALSAGEMQLLSLMQGRFRQGTLSLLEGAVRLTGASAEAELALPTMDRATVRLTLRAVDPPLSQDALAHAAATACLGVLGRLSGMGCDALGLGRQAVVHTADMAEWQALGWPARCREVEWAVSVGVEAASQ